MGLHLGLSNFHSRGRYTADRISFAAWVVRSDTVAEYAWKDDIKG